MKYCSLPFEGLYVYPNGDVRVCGWTYECIGNLLEDDFDHIWHSEKAERIRDSIRDGSFCLCNQSACQFCINDNFEELEKEEFNKRTVAAKYPTVIDAAYDYICNHACPSCRNGLFIPDQDYINKIVRLQESLLPLLNQASFVSLNGNGDLFASKYLMELIQKLRPSNPNFQIAIQTNGVLFNEKNWNKIKHLQSSHIGITVTPNSFEPLTYKYLSGGFDNLDKLIQNLSFMKKLREEGKIDSFDISIVVQDRNYRELPQFVTRCIEEFDCNRVVIKPIFYWFALTHEEYWFKDILNPKHPYFEEYMEILKDPILKHPKVYFWGGDDIHEEKDYPSISYKTYFEGFAKLIKNENPKKMLEESMIKKGYNKVAIYGTNEMAEILFYLLAGTKVKIEGFIDRDAKTSKFCGLEVQKMEDFDPNIAETIIVSNFVFMENIERDLRFRNYKGRLIPYCDLLD